MTQWVENPEGGRDRGPVALARAWVTVLVRPRRFFRAAVAPGDQAPGLVFAVAVVLVAEGSRLALRPEAIPAVGSSPPLAAALWLGVVALFLTPLAIHLVAALQTLLLAPVAPDRGGTSETVQVLGYATAPCVVAGLPSPEIRLLAVLYGTLLLVVGTAERHHVELPLAAAVAAVPAVLVFGVGFRGVGAAETLTGWTVEQVADVAVETLVEWVGLLPI